MQRIDMRRIPMSRISIGIIFLLFLRAATPALFPTTLTAVGGIALENTSVKLNMENTLVKLNGDLSTFSYYDVMFHIDPVLRNMFQGGATFNIWLFRFGIGALFSTFNEGGEKYAPGVSGSIGIESPGVISLYVEYGQNLFTDLNSDGEVYLNYGKVEAAIWLPHILARFIMQRKSLRVEPAGNYDLDDSLVRYQVLLDIFFRKTTPFFITLGGGRETLDKITEPLPGAAPSARRKETKTVSQFASIEASWKVNPDWTLFLNAEVPFSSQGGKTLFKAAAGFKVELSNFNW
jgi:hypothetical protein